MSDLFERIFGVPSTADARSVLGLRSANVQAAQIDEALRVRLAIVYQHAESRGAEADEVRARLRAAADELRKVALQRGMSELALEAIGSKPSPRAPVANAPPAQPLFNLTAFDRLVLAVLIGCGGWNSRSRAQLVALASTYGVTVHGLMRVVQGLSRYAQTGGGRLGVTEITAGQSLATYMPPTPSGAPLGPALLDKLTENLSTELKRDDPWPTIKLAAIFGIATLLAGIIALRILTGSSNAVDDSVQQPPAPIVTSTNPASAPAIVVPQASASRTRVATFPRTPTFLGNALPAEAIAEARACQDVPDHLDELARKLVVEDTPSEAIYKRFEAAAATISTGWILCDASTRKQIDRKLYEVLRAAGPRPHVCERLLNAIIAPSTLNQPLAIWRGTWLIGMQAQIANAAPDDGLPPPVVQRARGLLQASLPHQFNEVSSFETAASAWLEQQTSVLVQAMETDERTYDYWELWLAAQRALGKGERHDRAIMNAIARVLETHTDLARPGPTVNILARLVIVALENPSEAVAGELYRLIDSEAVSSRDLWVLTSLIAASDAATWFPDRLVIPEDADQRHRWRVRDDLLTIWPRIAASTAVATNDPAARPPRVDAKLFEQWNQALDQLATQPSATHHPTLSVHEAQLHQLIQMSRMNEAIEALYMQRPDHAAIALELAQSVPGSPSPARSTGSGGMTAPVQQNPAAMPQRAGAPRTLQSSGADGVWASAYQAVRTAEEKIDLLRQLSAAGGDLGPLDADVLARETYRGSPQEVRTLAQEIVQHFSRGPTMSIAMIDQFAEAGPNEAVSKCVQDFTSQSLSDVRSAEWKVEARIALVKHAISLRPEASNRIDELANQLIESYVARVTLLRKDPSPSIAPQSPEEAASHLLQFWLDSAQVVVAATAVPDSLPGLHRRRTTLQQLADGPMQSMAARQLAILDLLTYITVAEQPHKAQRAEQLLHTSADARRQVTAVLEQSLQIERVIARMWRLRVELQQPQNTSASRQDSSDRPRIVDRFIASSVVMSVALLQTDGGTPTRGTSQWNDRLQALDPSQPLMYLELAEEVAEAANDDAQRELARHLFGLAGVLDPHRLGRSACLAVADLEANPQTKRQLLALASLFGTGFDSISGRADAFKRTDNVPMSAVLALAEAMGHFRRGAGARALEALRKPGATELLQQHDRHLPGGAAKFIEDCKHYRGQARPNVASSDLIRMLELELALLSGSDRSWSSDLLLHGNLPLVEVDPTRLHQALGVDGSKPVYRSGRWVER